MTKVLHLTFTELQEVSVEDLQRVWHASTERSPFRILGIVSYGTLFTLIVEPICPNTRTRQIIRYRATATLRRPQNKQYSV